MKLLTKTSSNGTMLVITKKDNGDLVGEVYFDQKHYDDGECFMRKEFKVEDGEADIQHAIDSFDVF